MFVNFGDWSLKLPESKVRTENYEKLLSYGGKQVIMGIRPENIYDDPMYLEKFNESIITADVEVTEKMGAETYLYLDVQENKFTARVDPSSIAKPGDNIKIALDMNRVHLFDIDTEQTIIN